MKFLKAINIFKCKMFLRLNLIYVKNESTNIYQIMFVCTKNNERAGYFYNYVKMSTKSLLPLEYIAVIEIRYSADFWR